MGYSVIIPSNAKVMKESGDFDVTHYQTWFQDANDYHKKTKLMSDHFDEIARGDVTLILNYEKRGIANYIGGNVLMEMAVAFYLKKPIVVLNDLPKDSAYLEELMGVNPIILNGDISLLPAKLKS